MAESGRRISWPVLVCVALLFVMSVTAPRAWERIARSDGFRPAVIRRQAARSERPNVRRAAVEASESQAIALIESPISESAAWAAEPEMPLVDPTIPAFELRLVAPSQGESPSQDDSPSLSIWAPNPKSQIPNPTPDDSPSFGISTPQIEIQIRPQDVRPLPAAASRWPTPVALIAWLDAQADAPAVAAWAAEVQAAIDALTAPEGCAEEGAVFARLDELLFQVDAIAVDLGDESGSRLRRAGHALRRRLDIWGVVATDEAFELLPHLERYEATQLPSDGREVAQRLARLSQSPLDEDRPVAQRVANHYRGCNLRLAVTEDLVNRIVPRLAPEARPVRDRILDLAVRGRSTTTTDVEVDFVPDPYDVHIALQARGTVSSRTTADAGPAQLRSRSSSEFVVSKQIELGRQGVRAWPAEVSADVRTQLEDIESDFDWMPIIGSVVREVIRTQHESREGEAEREVRRKVSMTALSRMEREAAEKSNTARRQFDERVLVPLKTMSIVPTAADFQTTEDRITARARLAADEQLGAHTPRPRAPSDSLLSLQVHESAVNNLFARMELEGRSFTLPELHEWVAGRLNRQVLPLDEALPDDVRITFADRDAIRIRCDDGRIELTVSVAELERPGQDWRDFNIRVYYRPDPVNLSAELVRDGSIQLPNTRLGTRAQVALRGIAAKLFARNQRWNISPPTLAAEPQAPPGTAPSRGSASPRVRTNLGGFTVQPPAPPTQSPAGIPRGPCNASRTRGRRRGAISVSREEHST